MKLKIDWHKHPSEKNTIVGICGELPDTYSHFMIRRIKPNWFWVIPPMLIFDSRTSKLILRDAETARDFCEDFLNTNLKTIIRNQLRQMKGSSLQPEKPVRYYEDFLQKVQDWETR